jgi:hypothetical protein
MRAVVNRSNLYLSPGIAKLVNLLKGSILFMLTRLRSFLLLVLTPGLLAGQTVTSWVSRTIGGSFPLGDGGQATAALLEMPEAVAADAAGNLYIADGGNGVIRKVSRTGIITSLWGTRATPTI